MANVTRTKNTVSKPVTAENVTPESFEAITGRKYDVRKKFRARVRATLERAKCDHEITDGVYTVLSDDGNGKYDILGTITHDGDTGEATFTIAEQPGKRDR